MEPKEKEEKFVNGVNVDALFSTIDAIKETPVIAEFKFRAKGKWINGGNSHVSITDFYGVQKDHPHQKPFELEADEPPLLLGWDKGPNPVEYALTGLSGCLTASLIYHSAARGIEIKGVETRLEGDLNLRGFLGLSDDIKVGYENIRVYFKLDADVSEEEKKDLIRMAQKYSPVFNTIANPTPVIVELDKS